MEQYQVKGPDGAVHIFQGPDGATPDEVVSAAQQFFGAQQAAHQKAIGDTASWQASINPTDGMSTFDKLRAGIGQGMSNVVSGVGQAIHKALPDQGTTAGNLVRGALAAGVPGGSTLLLTEKPQSDIDDSKRLDAPLLNTGAGKVGSVIGNVAAALPATMIPGVNGYAGAAALGGAMGALQPVASDDGDFARLKNTAVGAAAAPLGIFAGRATNAVYQAGKAIVQPLTQTGRNQIAGNVLARFADDPSSVANATSAPTITGALPTLAEQTGDRGIASLQDALSSIDPQIGTQIGNRLATNNAARVNQLSRLAGADGGRDFAVANRAGTAGPMYDQALGVVPDASSLTVAQSRTLQTLMRSPAIQAAMKDAQTIAQNNGTNIGPSNASGSMEGLHNMKLAMDDQIAAATNAGNPNLASSIKTAQGKLVDYMEQVSPDYANARGVYAQMSKPINSMDVADQVAKRGLSNGTDLTTGSPTINRNALLGALRDEPALIRQATGRTGLGNSLSDVMAPDDENMLRTIAAEADRAGAVQAAGNGPGSATAKRMASQNVLSSLLGPLGTPGGASETWMKSLGDALFKSPVGGAVNMLHAGYEPDIQRTLAQAVLDPDSARAVLAAAQKSNTKLPANLLQRLALTASGSTSANSANDAFSSNPIAQAAQGAR